MASFLFGMPIGAAAASTGGSTTDPFGTIVAQTTEAAIQAACTAALVAYSAANQSIPQPIQLMLQGVVQTGLTTALPTGTTPATGSPLALIAASAGGDSPLAQSVTFMSGVVVGTPTNNRISGTGVNPNGGTNFGKGSQLIMSRGGVVYERQIILSSVYTPLSIAGPATTTFTTATFGQLPLAGDTFIIF